jgi:hypothetical protein
MNFVKVPLPLWGVKDNLGVNRPARKKPEMDREYYKYSSALKVPSAHPRQAFPNLLNKQCGNTQEKSVIQGRSAAEFIRYQPFFLLIPSSFHATLRRMLLVRSKKRSPCLHLHFLPSHRV